ncbi:hypothetical protein SOCE26_087120 [Sorangium cellulosum]|uniref:Peptidase C51 domain-containing protein n=1 Tax=Sorangium cellulosum TaxID=56 RepID=A0A2L0F6L4_SORCE|nr:hypothetical protein [Sorangium cellulosum]AUX47200.1 hypothetical protein SOCE26_087120 [Sorangium cellulosum]
MNASKRRSSRSVVHALPAVILAGLCALAPRAAQAQSAAEPSLLYWANTLADHVAPENNEYGSSPSYVFWAGVAGSSDYKSRTFCSTFVTNVLKQTYGLSSYHISTWFGSTSPNAILYHDRIVQQVGFEQIWYIDEIAAGDVIAIKYPAGSMASGHVAIAAGAARPRIASYPYVSGTTQYEIAVVDSSNTGHGMTDSRRNPDGSWHPGVGKGLMRFYANSSGEIVGHTWSPQASATYYPNYVRAIAVGRVTTPYAERALPE